MGRPGLHNHPKFKRAQMLLGAPIPHLRGYLECLWDVAYECGNPVIGDDTDVGLACGYPGNPKEICEALLNCGGPGHAGFIERLRDGRYQVHDLFDHAPDYVQRRFDREQQRRHSGKTLSDVRRAAALARWNKSPDANGCKCTPLADSQDANGATPAPAPAPNNPPSPLTGGDVPAAKREEQPEGCASETAGFIEFWDGYPDCHRKVARAQCHRFWRRKGLDAIAAEIVAAVKRHRGLPEWKREGGAFIPKPLTWLTERRWEAPLKAPAARQAPDPAEALVASMPAQDLQREVQEFLRAFPRLNDGTKRTLMQSPMSISDFRDWIIRRRKVAG